MRRYVCIVVCNTYADATASLTSIFQALFKNPQVAADGFTYEKEDIETWFKINQEHDKPTTSPVTGAVLPDLRLIPNRSLNAALNQFKDLFPTS